MKRWKFKSVLPGFGLSLGYTVFYLSLIVLIPLAAMILKSTSLGWANIWYVINDPRLISAFLTSFQTAFIAACINAVFGFIVAWVLVKYSFPGKRFIDGLIDLPFALPTAVAGISLTALFSHKAWLGGWFADLGIKTAFSVTGITIALTFIGLPFVVRTLQPVLQDMESEAEEAAVMLGAYRWRTFRRVIFPELFPALLTGFALAFSRGLGEYGSVVFISGNIPMETEIVPLLIMTKLEQFDLVGATVISTAMLVISFVILFFINMIQWYVAKRASKTA